MRIFVSLCAACLMAGAAWAQQDNPDNPHSTLNKDKQPQDVPNSVTKAQTEKAEQANPHSVLNKDRTEGAAPTQRQMDAAQTENPESLQYKDRDHMAGMDHDMMANATPQMQLQKLHHVNLHEIEAGKLAEQNGSDKVKDYARTLQRDHQDADQKVMALAKKKGFTLSDQPMMQHHAEKKQAEKDTLASLHGAQFDRTFADMMSKGHQHVIQMAQGWRASCKDQDVCALIDELMPKLQQHKQMADSIRGPMPQGRTPAER